VLTVNGEAQVVIQDARAYEEMLNLLHSLMRLWPILGMRELSLRERHAKTASNAYRPNIQIQTYSVVVTKTAEFELDEYFDYIAHNSIPNPITWHSNIYDKIETLSKMATLCPMLTRARSLRSMCIA
jgi:hypothetical protein